MGLADEDISIEEADFNNDWLKGEHPCEGCSTIIGEGEILCPQCEEQYELYINGDDGTGEHTNCGTFK